MNIIKQTFPCDDERTNSWTRVANLQAASGTMFFSLLSTWSCYDFSFFFTAHFALQGLRFFYLICAFVTSACLFLVEYILFTLLDEYFIFLLLLVFSFSPFFHIGSSILLFILLLSWANKNIFSLSSEPGLSSRFPVFLPLFSFLLLALSPSIFLEDHCICSSFCSTFHLFLLRPVQWRAPHRARCFQDPT